METNDLGDTLARTHGARSGNEINPAKVLGNC